MSEVIPMLTSMSAHNRLKDLRNVRGPQGSTAPAKVAEQRAARSGWGKMSDGDKLRTQEERLRRQKNNGTRPLQGGGLNSNYWL